VTQKTIDRIGLILAVLSLALALSPIFLMQAGVRL
jgi:hypothetical protein